MCLQRTARRLAALLVSTLALTTPLRLAAQSTGTNTLRRIRVAIKPEYSPLAKQLNLSGVVKVEVVVSAEGKVKRAHVLGGHPVLALEAEKAALLTEFEPAPKETTQILEFHFDGGK